MEEKLPVNKFARINKSYIVSAVKITVIKRDWINVGDLELPVSDFYKENLMRIANK
jgi:DNA-binding LytR/AlgR family response regulator